MQDIPQPKTPWLCKQGAAKNPGYKRTVIRMGSQRLCSVTVDRNKIMQNINK